MSTNPPSRKAMLAYLEKYPGSATYSCHECGKTDTGYYVQPQHPFYMNGLEGLALCADCIARHNVEYREKRKAQLAEEPRCSVEGCKRRGNWKACGVLLCGHHLKNAKRGHARASASYGPFALFASVWFDRTSILRWASGQEDSAEGGAA